LGAQLFTILAGFFAGASVPSHRDTRDKPAIGGLDLVKLSLDIFGVARVVSVPEAFVTAV
jgi:hypothetical protein